MPEGQRHELVSNVMSRIDGIEHIPEIADQYYLWYPTKDRMDKIQAGGGVAEILEILQAGRQLDFGEIEDDGNRS